MDATSRNTAGTSRSPARDSQTVRQPACGMNHKNGLKLSHSFRGSRQRASGAALGSQESWPYRRRLTSSGFPRRTERLLMDVVANHCQGIVGANARRCAPSDMLFELTHLIDALPGLAWTALPDGRAEFLNRRWFDYTGLTAEQAADLGWIEAIHPDDRERVGDYWRSCVISGISADTSRLGARRDTGRGPLRGHSGDRHRWARTAWPIVRRLPRATGGSVRTPNPSSGGDRWTVRRPRSGHRSPQRRAQDPI